MATPSTDMAMPVRLLLWLRRSVTLLFETRARRLLLIATAVLLFIVTFGYHALLALVQIEAEPAMEIAYDLVVLLCYGLIFAMLLHFLEPQRQGPLRIFWGSTLMLGVLFALTLLWGEGRIDPASGIPVDLETALMVALYSLLEAIFGFVVLIRLRELVLFKRTKRSVRQWYGMVAMMWAASTSTFTSSDLNPLAMILTTIAVVFMVFNAFRLSWIVLLSFKDKLLTSLFCIIFVALLILHFQFESDVFLYVRFYSLPLFTFVMLCIVFGILYSTTIFLSLLFHLPTTSDFQQKTGELEAMHSVTRLTGDVFNMEKLVTTIVTSPVEVGLGKSAWLALIDPQTGSLRPRVMATRNITPAHIKELIDTEALCEEAAQRKGVILLNQAAADHRVRARPGDGLESLLVMPLISRGESLGALFVSKDVSHGFEGDDVAALTTFVDQVSLALENARLFQERLERERLSREWAIAREVQQKLLPQKLPTISGLSIAVSNVSAHDVGGDYYDFMQIDDDRWAFIVGDVSGKGASAAFYMAVLKGIFQSLSSMTASPTTFLEHANRALSNSMEKNIFISVVYGVLDIRQATLTLARAGHCPVARVKPGGEARFLRTPGLGLGLDRGPLFRKVLVEELISLEAGDTFVFYTDGVVESRNEQGEEYGYDRFLQALREHHNKSVYPLHMALLEDLNQFIGSATYDDDMTMLVIKWEDHPAPPSSDGATTVTMPRTSKIG